VTSVRDPLTPIEVALARAITAAIVKELRTEQADDQRRAAAADDERGRATRRAS
jgi:hypothetical protein